MISNIQMTEKSPILILGTPNWSFLLSVCAAEPARQAPNKRRKRKVSGGSTVSSGGGGNNSNSKKKSPANSFSLSNQVPGSITPTWQISAPAAEKGKGENDSRLRGLKRGTSRLRRHLWLGGAVCFKRPQIWGFLGLDSIFVSIILCRISWSN